MWITFSEFRRNVEYFGWLPVPVLSAVCQLRRTKQSSFSEVSESYYWLLACCRLCISKDPLEGFKMRDETVRHLPFCLPVCFLILICSPVSFISSLVKNVRSLRLRMAGITLCPPYRWTKICDYLLCTREKLAQKLLWKSHCSSAQYSLTVPSPYFHTIRFLFQTNEDFHL